MDVSIHAPVKGATPFNAKIENIFIVSIHAPVKGATLIGVAIFLEYVCFNPRAREGRDA